MQNKIQEGRMIPVGALFEGHLTVGDLERSMEFYGGVLGLECAAVFAERRAAFYWLGSRGRSMLGIWEAGSAPQRMSLHLAFAVEPEDILRAPEELRAAEIEPLDFWGNPCGEPVVLAWMPAASLYFRDPDGHMLEFLAMLPEPPAPERGIVAWGAWRAERR
jgi:lactoylglutathione lyase